MEVIRAVKSAVLLKAQGRLFNPKSKELQACISRTVTIVIALNDFLLVKHMLYSSNWSAVFKYSGIEFLEKDNALLMRSAQQVQANAHAPYSGYKVGAALIAEDDNVYCGCNVENAAYPLGQCAEAGAISNMVAQGMTKISKILIMSPDNNFCPPCGGCRQKIKEFAAPNTQIILCTQEGKTQELSMAELLPFAFDLN